MAAEAGKGPPARDSAVPVRRRAPTAQDFRAQAARLEEVPGVYQMLGADDMPLYVGKAKSLRRRVASYFQGRGLSARIQAMLARVRQVQVTVTASETEALLLEQNLIKKYHPPYNILLRDDKSYPYIHLSEENFPRLSFRRGRRPGAGRVFGPYPGAAAMRDSLNFLHRTFRLRQCENAMFRNRSRPCLQYQIKRCTAPCVGLISQEKYAESVRHAVMFLDGHGRDLAAELADQMEAAAKDLDYEGAAMLRDRVTSLRLLQESQYVEGESGDVDILAAALSSGSVCVQLLYIRAGRVLGSRSFFPRLPLAETPAQVLAAFVPRYYLEGHVEVPRALILSHAVSSLAPLTAALEQAAGHRVEVRTRVRGPRARWLRLCLKTAGQNLIAAQTGEQRTKEQFEQLREALTLPEVPQRLECFDISHSSGRETVASCVVFDANGPRKSEYRRFNIRDIAPGDDYAALRQAFLRRYTRVKEGEGHLPDVLFIDGGRGQLRQAAEVWVQLSLPGTALIAVAKGAGRKPGRERLFCASGRQLRLPPESGALHLVQRIRDEAHRFAVIGHRQRRAARSRGSVLEQIPGIGAARRRQLLRFFGGLQKLERASAEDIARTPGIGPALAALIHDSLHSASPSARTVASGIE